MTRDTIWSFVMDAPTQASDIGSRAWPPRWSYLSVLWRPLWDTLNMATLGTLLGIVMAVPIAFAAARNTTPSAYVVRPIALLLIVASRSINALIWALLLVAVLGPGLLPGVIAIALRSVGFVAKLLYEAIEEIDRATGRGDHRDRRAARVGRRVRDRPADPAGVRRHLRVPLGHQHPRVDGPRPRRRRRDRASARSVAEHASVAASQRDPDCDPDDGDRRRMGVGKGAARDHLTRAELAHSIAAMLNQAVAERVVCERDFDRDTRKCHQLAL